MIGGHDRRPHGRRRHVAGTRPTASAAVGRRQQTRAVAVAVAAVRLASQRGVTLPPDLRLWTFAGGRPAGAGAQAPVLGGGGERADGHGGELAEVLEAVTSAEQRRSAGLHVTPGWLADHLVALGLAGGAAPWLPTVCDPACGGGVFLVAAAEGLRRRGVGRTQIVQELLWGADIDPVGLAAAEAALAIWSGGEEPPRGRLVVGDPLRDGAGVWADRPPTGFGLVVGNPPFQNQLERTTARPRAERDRLRDRFGGVLRAYTDTAWLFLLLACELAEPGGRAVLVQPESVVAARDAAAVRAAVDRMARIVDLWVDDRQVFAARVRVCAPVLEIDRVDAQSSTPADPGGDGTRPSPHGRREPWHDLLADATGIPRIALSATAGRLGDRATIAAGFRDEYYGLIPLVSETQAQTPANVDPPSDPTAGPLGAGDVAPGASTPQSRFGGLTDGPRPAVASPGPMGRSLAPLVTVGAIDWGRSAWGRRPLRFAKRRWAAPAVDLTRLDATGSPAARRWVDRTRVPKIVVATQTKVLELAVDEHGEWVPSVPVIAVVPERREDLWRLAAALASPAATAWLARRTPGVGLHRGALKVSRRELAELPLPADGRAWEEAAAALRDLATGADPAALERFVASAAAAYGAEPALVEWWRQRLGPMP